jgi:hypothetical protein
MSEAQLLLFGPEVPPSSLQPLAEVSQEWSLAADADPVHVLGALKFIGRARQLGGFIVATQEGSPYLAEIMSRSRGDLGMVREQVVASRKTALWEAGFQLKMATDYFPRVESRQMTREQANEWIARGLTDLHDTYFGDQAADQRRATFRRALEAKVEARRAGFAA